MGGGGGGVEWRGGGGGGGVWVGWGRGGGGDVDGGGGWGNEEVPRVGGGGGEGVDGVGGGEGKVWGRDLDGVEFVFELGEEGGVEGEEVAEVPDGEGVEDGADEFLAGG